MYKTIIDDPIINKIRNEVKNVKNKIHVAMKYGISYYLVKKHTQDIPTIMNLSKQLQQRIREEIKKGKSIRQVAKELHVSRDSVIKYTQDIPKHWEKPGRTMEEINQIRKNVIKYNSRFKTAKIMDISYSSDLVI